MSKFVKVMFGTTSGAKSDFKYKIGEVNISNNWNPSAEKGRDFGGFNYCSEECILRWLHRGDTIYDVEVPKDAENIKLEGATTIYRTNKIIIKNPRKVDDDLALHFYNISNIPEKSYYKALGVVTIMGYKKTALSILRDKVNEDNIDEVLEEWNDFIGKGNRYSSNELVNCINEALYEIKDKRLITLHLNRSIYEKTISDDKIINITGESGSGKSTYIKEYLNNDNYIVIDTDEITKDKNTSNKNCIEFREYLKKKYNDNVPDICNEFSVIYNDILNYYKDTDKTLVIDSAQFRNLRTENEIKLLKGKIIILRTSVDECYKRVIDRWKKINENYTEDDLIKYQNKKIGMYKWYKSLNEFIKNIDNLKKKEDGKMKETLGKVIKITSKGIDSPTVVEVEYQVNNENYIIKESLKLKSETIKIGIIPIGQRKKPKVNCQIGDTITIEYDENNPDKGHIKGNDGMMNC